MCVGGCVCGVCCRLVGWLCEGLIGSCLFVLSDCLCECVFACVLARSFLCSVSSSVGGLVGRLRARLAKCLCVVSIA